MGDHLNGRRSQKAGSSGKSVWRCISRLEPTGQECHARTVNETVLENVVVQAINTLLGNKSTYQAQLQQNIAKGIRSAQQNTAMALTKDCRSSRKSFSKRPITKRPMMRLQTRSSNSGNGEKNARLTLLPETRRLPASINCRISSSSSPHTWKPSMRPW